MLRPIWDAFSRENMLKSILGKEGFQIRLIPPKPSPWGEGGPAQPGRMRGRFGTQPFLVEKGGSRLSPQRNFSPAPLGNPVAPSSVTFGDSFPPRGSLWVVLPYTKKASQIRVRRWAPKQPPYRNTAPHHAKTSEWQRAGHKKGGPGGTPLGFFLPISSQEMGTPARGRAGTHVAGLDLHWS